MQPRVDSTACVVVVLNEVVNVIVRDCCIAHYV